MRLLRNHMARNFCMSFLLALAAMLTACGTPSPSSPQDSTKVPPLRQDPLRIGDRVKVELSGIPEKIDPSEQDVHDDGSIILPWLGPVTAVGVSPSELERQIRAKYVPAYFTHINVTVTPVARYFFVGGQVMMPGRVLYSGQVTLTRAIQTAGDFTPFADKKRVQVTRVDGTIEHVNWLKAIKNPKLDVQIHPGDQIQVGRRF
jgi:polysaccharide export outer membrane protein